ncbi:MAG: metallophosphoesterase [Bacteroidales bacterium]|nr:metallophosphoesterase [Bacteroidales bacterium]
MKTSKTMILAVAALLACACTPRFVIVHTNDTHSHLDPVRTGSRAGRGGIIERAAIVDSIRKAEGESRVLLLHAGDWNQGTTYYTELGGRMEVNVVNAMRYDCIALGNHEFDNGIEDLTERVRDVECPIVCANLDLSSFELGNYVKPYAILEKGGVKIGIIGLICDLTSVVSKMSSSRVPQEEPAGVLNRYAEKLRSEEGCGYIIALTHVGFDEDLRIAAESRGVDLFVGGHSHTVIDDIRYVKNLDGKKVGVVTDGEWGLELAELKVY